MTTNREPEQPNATPGHQRGPVSIARIQAQSRQVARELGEPEQPAASFAGCNLVWTADDEGRAGEADSHLAEDRRCT